MSSSDGTFDTTRQIASIWDIDDVKCLDENISDEKAMVVLRLCKRYFDASIGINWDTISYWLNEVKENKYE